MNKRKINFGIDVLRLVSSIAIVGIHTCNAYVDDNIVASTIAALTSFAVPSFFITSGYFFRDNQNGNIIIRIKPLIRYVMIYVLTLIIYSTVFSRSLHLETFKQILLFIASPTIIARHLWFMVALTLGWMFLFIVRNLKSRLLISILILSIGILGNPFSVISGGFYDILYPHLLAIPFMTFGIILKNNTKLNTIKIRGGIICVIILLLIAESLYWATKCDKISQFYLMTYVFSAVIFMYFSTMKNFNSFLLSVANYGNRYSLFIYLYHMMLISLLSMYFFQFDNMIATWLVYTTVIWTLCLLLVMLLKKFAITSKIANLLEWKNSSKCSN